MSLFFQILSAGGSVGIVTVSGEVITDSQADPGPADAAVRFKTDGTVEKYESFSYTQIDAATDWIIPNLAASKRSYVVKATELGQTGTGSRTGPTLGSWHALTTNREWKVSRTSGVGSATWDLTIEISADGGTTTLDSATYNLTATLT